MSSRTWRTRCTPAICLSGTNGLVRSEGGLAKYSFKIGPYRWRWGPIWYSYVNGILWYSLNHLGDFNLDTGAESTTASYLLLVLRLIVPLALIFVFDCSLLFDRQRITGIELDAEAVWLNPLMLAVIMEGLCLQTVREN